MTGFQRPSRAVGPCASAAVVACALAAAVYAPRKAGAELPSTTPSFGAPLEVTSPWMPFVPGAVKVFAGRERRANVLVLERHLHETREFSWNGAAVACRVIEEMEFVGGAAVGREQMYVAQADDGSVWTFGEIEDNDDPAHEDGGWIVGSRLPSDPVETVEGAQPALMMPADPEAGDQWKNEDVPPLHVSTVRVQSVRADVRTRGGRFPGSLRVVEVDDVDGERELEWFAPGVGLVSSRSRVERLDLQATSLRRSP